MTTKMTTMTAPVRPGGSNNGSRNSDPLSTQALICMFLLSLQFGIQPILSKKFTPPSICRSSVILVQEVVKFVFASIMLFASGNFKSAVYGWSVHSWLRVAGFPAALYSVQNLAALLAYQNLDALTFCVLNQTKTLSAALCCYLVMGRRQSRAQILSLFLLLAAALVIEKVMVVPPSLSSNWWSSSSSTSSSWQDTWKISYDTLFSTTTVTASYDHQDVSEMVVFSKHLSHGVLPVLLASFLSGLAGALSQKNLQQQQQSSSSSSSSSSSTSTTGRNSYLFTMELCVASTLFLLVTLLTPMGRADGMLMVRHGFFYNWQPQTLIPIVVNAGGGIVVGLVTKHAGSVRKGFALIFGLLLSGVLQQQQQGSSSSSSSLSTEQIVGGGMAAVSLYIHTTNPYCAAVKTMKRVKTE